jgi:hypothetical protein
MYHEDAVILGVLCWRSTPDGDWTEYTAHQITRMLVAREARVHALEMALTPTGDTKAAYIGEHPIEVDDGNGGSGMVLIPWTTTKEIMAMIRKHADDSAPKTTVKP